MAQLPLQNVRVIDLTSVFALPYTTALMADLGAEVIKVEGCSRLDITRVGMFAGAYADMQPDGDWWNRTSLYSVLNRGKRSITLDMRQPKAREILRHLVRVSDVVMENFTPRVMKGWGLDYPGLREIRPDIIMVSNTAYGHGSGPYSPYPGQATTMEGTHGHAHITGYIDGPPSKAGQSYVDFLATWSALFAVAAALRHRHRTGQGQWIDIGMYQLGVLHIAEYLLDYQANGRRGGRIGNRHPFRAPQGCYPTRGDDQWVVLSVGSDEEWRALCRVMGRADLARDPRFATGLDRMQHHDALDEAIARWTTTQERYDAFHRLQQAGIPAAPVLDARDLHMDPHFRARGLLESVRYPSDHNMGVRQIMGRPWKLSRTPLHVRGPASRLGEDNQYVFGEVLGLSAGQVQELESEGVTGTAPTTSMPAPLSPEELAAARNIVAYDPDYRATLGYDDP